jgi:hypothetical protein
LVPVLWHTNTTIAGRAAWSLASLFPLPGILDALRSYIIGDLQRRDALSWVWDPFSEPETSAVPSIAGRIVSLISSESTDDSVPEGTMPLDPRLVIPICAIACRQQLRQIVTEPTPEMLVVAETLLSRHRLETGSRGAAFGQVLYRVAQSKPSIPNEKPAKGPDGLNELSDAVIKHPSLDTKLRFIFRSLKPSALLHLLYAIDERVITMSDWRSALKPLKYDLRTGWHFRLILAISSIVSGVAVFEMLLRLLHSARLITWSNSMLVFLIGCIVLCWLEFGFDIGYISGGDPREFIEFFAFGPFFAPGEFFFWLDSDPAWSFSMVPFVFWLPAVSYFASVWVHRYYSWSAVGAIFIPLLATCTVSWILGTQRSREANNPLHGIIDASGALISKAIDF